MVFQIWREDQVLVARSDSAPNTPIAPLEVGYRDLNFSGYRWRIYVHHDIFLKEWIIIAERSDIRSGLAEKVILESVLPTILALPIVALMIWIIVGLGLKPISKLAGQLRSKESDDLTPIPIDGSLLELNPLIESTNGLLHRLEASFLREKRFASNAAHELRTPISVLKVHLYNLQAEWPEQVVKLLPFKRSIERLERLVEQILALYRSTPDQYMAKFKTIELFGLVRTTIVDNYDQFDDKQQQIELLGKPGYLNGDQFAIQTLLQNLLSNACKYSPPGSTIIVTVSANGAEIVLCVEDSGPGIAENEYQKVFERFYRIHGSEDDSSIMGCGLGMAIIKHIADLHGASIKLGCSQFDSGLRVTLSFPEITLPKLDIMASNITIVERR
jgi:two-component system sensor histidine kinase QseC